MLKTTPHSTQPFDQLEIKAYNRLMADSFRRVTGTEIVPDSDALGDDELAKAMFEAPQAIVSHGTQTDPIFRYANARTLTLWEMDWDDFTRLPSRRSAEAQADIQSDRNALLKEALQTGCVDAYQGVRISATGLRFFIRNTVLWNVVDEAGTRHGQAAFIREWDYL